MSRATAFWVDWSFPSRNMRAMLFLSITFSRTLQHGIKYSLSSFSFRHAVKPMNYLLKDRLKIHSLVTLLLPSPKIHCWIRHWSSVIISTYTGLLSLTIRLHVSAATPDGAPSMQVMQPVWTQSFWCIFLSNKQQLCLTLDRPCGLQSPTKCTTFAFTMWHWP